MTLFSDWHFDEVVKAEEVQYRNEYNREIAERRLKRYVEGVCKVATSYVHGFRYPGIVVGMLGDIFSGNIHEELRATNADKIMGSILHWLDPMAAGLATLAECFGQVYVVSVVGNHGRSEEQADCQGAGAGQLRLAVRPAAGEGDGAVAGGQAGALADRGSAEATVQLV